METPSAQPSMIDGLTMTEESSISTSGDQEELNEARVLNMLASSMVLDASSQPNSDGFLAASELVKICEDANTAATVHSLIFQSGPVSLPQFLIRLASHCSSLYECSGEPDFIDKSLSFVKASKDALDSSDGAGVEEEHIAIYRIENEMCRQRFERFGDLGDIERAITTLDNAMEYADNDDSEMRAMLLYSRGSCLLRRFERLGDLGDLDQAVKTQQQVVDLTPDEHPDKASCLNNLGISLRTRFERLGDLGDLEQAVRSLQQAVNLTPDGHVDKPSLLNNLGLSLRTQFDRLGNLGDLDEAVTTHQQAVDLTSDGHASKPARLNNLGSSLIARFERLGGLSDLDQAIKIQRQAVDLMPDGHADKSSLLNNLGVSLFGRFQRLGELGDLDEAVQTQQQAVNLLSDGHASKPSRLNNLGNSFLTRFERLGELDDLDEGVKTLQESVDLSPDGHASKPSRLNNLGNSFLIRFQRLGGIDDLDRAVKTTQQAIDLTPDGHTDKPSQLNNLGNSLLRRSERLGDLGDLNKAVITLQQAVDLTPDGHADKPSRFNNLGNAFIKRFERLEDLDDLNQAAKTQQQAVGLTPDGHADKPGRLISLADFLKIRLLRYTTAQDRSVIVASLNTAATYPSGSPSVRFKAARKLAKFIHPQLQPYQTAIDLIPQVVWLGRTIVQRYNDLASLGELVMDAVSAACAQGEYDLALEWIEQGRAIIWGQILQLRSPLNTLQIVYPDLANELSHIASALEIAGTESTGASQGTLSAEEAAQKHRRLAEKWEDTLAIVRALPGFADFLKPKSASVLKHALADRIVVLVNVSRHQGDALVLQPRAGGSDSSSISHVPLPALSATKVNKARDKLINTLHLSGVRFRDPERGSAQKEATPKAIPGALPNILQMLWNDVAKPILEHLGYTTHKPTGNLPHITWCLTGALAILPFHAAGIYTGTSPNDKLFNYAVSSYTPSLTSLVEGLERTPTRPSARSLLAITQEATPNLTRLPATMREVDHVKTLMDKYNIDVTRMDGDQATVKSVSDAMNDHSWIHLACHGTQHATEPTKCAFALHDGSLELVDIMKKPLKRAEIAYLSACQTASGHAALPNEAIHLAAGMFTAGYQTVIATLWSIRDVDAPTVAQEFYDRLLSNPDGGAARALHEAVEVLRKKVGEENLLAWVPYIHIGC